MRKATKTNDKVNKTFAIDGNLAKKIKIEAINTDVTQSSLFEDVMLRQFEKIYEERKRKYEEMKKIKSNRFKVVKTRRRIDYERKQVAANVDVVLIKKWNDIKRIYGCNMSYYIETLIRNDIAQNYDCYKKIIEDQN